MQAPPERFLIKRQEYFVWLLEDILYHAFLRAAEVGTVAVIMEGGSDYTDLFTVKVPDVTLRDNDQLAGGAEKIANSFSVLQNTLLGKSPTLHRIAVDLMLKFAGEPQKDEVLDKIIGEAKADPIEQVLLPGKEPAADKPNKGEETNNAN